MFSTFRNATLTAIMAGLGLAMRHSFLRTGIFAATLVAAERHPRQPPARSAAKAYA
jgi:hypothetical protein